MLLSNTLGHAAELHYEKDLLKQGLSYEKAPTDKFYDYIVEGKKDQVKRFESSTTNTKRVSANLTKTHGDRSGEGNFYKRGSFDRLVLLDVGFYKTHIVEESDIPANAKYSEHLPGTFKLERNLSQGSEEFDKDFLMTMKVTNKDFPDAVEELRIKYNLSSTDLLMKMCDLNLEEIDSLFTDDNFRLVVGARGFAAEEHFNIYLEENNIQYEQIKDMYSKIDHVVNGKFDVQVKTPHERSNGGEFYGFKTHKSHGSGVGELYKNDEFDLIALFTGFEIDEEYSRYIPKKTSREFVFIPTSDIEEHPNHPGYLKRVTKVSRKNYKVNDLSIFK